MIMVRGSWKAPLPPPSILEEYNNAVPNGAERIFSMVERQTRHAMEIEAATVESDNKLAQRGQLIGLVVVVLSLALAGYMAHLGATAIAAAVAGLDLVGLVAVFIYGSRRRRNATEIQVDDADIEVE